MFESRKEGLSEGSLVVSERTRKKNHDNEMFVGLDLNQNPPEMTSASIAIRKILYKELLKAQRKGKEKEKTSTFGDAAIMEGSLDNVNVLLATRTQMMSESFIKGVPIIFLQIEMSFTPTNL